MTRLKYTEVRNICLVTRKYSEEDCLLKCIKICKKKLGLTVRVLPGRGKPYVHSCSACYLKHGGKGTWIQRMYKPFCNSNTDTLKRFRGSYSFIFLIPKFCISFLMFKQKSGKYCTEHRIRQFQTHSKVDIFEKYSVWDIFKAQI